MSVNEQSKELKVCYKGKDHPEPKEMVYENPEGCRGVLHIFNNYKFTNTNKNLKCGSNDGKVITDVFQKLDYKVKQWNNLTKDETDEAFESIIRTKGLCEEKALIVFVLSHGSDVFTFSSSDDQPINLREKMDMFRTDNCDAMAYKPKMFLSDFCHGEKDQRGVLFHSKASNSGGTIEYFGKEEVLTNTLYVMASHPGIAAVYDDHSSFFSNTICEMLKEEKYQTQALDNPWFQELNKRLRFNYCPNTVRTTYDPFPGQLFYQEGFSFGYNMANVNGKKG